MIKIMGLISINSEISPKPKETLEILLHSLIRKLKLSQMIFLTQEYLETREIQFKKLFLSKSKNQYISLILGSQANKPTDLKNCKEKTIDNNQFISLNLGSQVNKPTDRNSSRERKIVKSRLIFLILATSIITSQPKNKILKDFQGLMILLLLLSKNKRTILTHLK